MFKHASKALTLTLWLHRTTKYLFWGILLSLTSMTVHKSLSSAFINWTCFYIILHIDLSLNCQHSYTMYNKNVRGSDGAGVGSILSRGDAGGLHQNFVWCTADVGGAGNALPRPAPPHASVLFLLAYTQQLIHLGALRCTHTSMTWQLVLPLVERRSGAPRRQGAAAGETEAASSRTRMTNAAPFFSRSALGAAEGRSALSFKCFCLLAKVYNSHSFVQVLKRN